MSIARRYITVIQAPEGYSIDPEPVEAVTPSQPSVLSVVSAIEYDRVWNELVAARDVLDDVRDADPTWVGVSQAIESIDRVLRGDG